MVVGRIGVLAVPYSETGYMQRSVTVGQISRWVIPAWCAEMKSRRGGWLQD